MEKIILPETPVFSKTRELYGLYETKQSRKPIDRFVVVEGYMDVIALAQHDIHYAVATLGTATSEHHLSRLFRLVNEIIFCFDGDKAGRSAAERALLTVLPMLEDGKQARFLFLDEGQDPDSLVRQVGKQVFETLLKDARPVERFLFDLAADKLDVLSLMLIKELFFSIVPGASVASPTPRPALWQWKASLVCWPLQFSPGMR